MTRRGVFVARRVAAGLFLVALVAFVVLFAPRACGVLYGPVDEQTGSSENAAPDEEPARKDDRSGDGTSAEGVAPIPGTSGEKAEGVGVSEDVAPPENDEDADNGTGGSPEDDVDDGGEGPGGSQARAPEESQAEAPEAAEEVQPDYEQPDYEQPEYEQPEYVKRVMEEQDPEKPGFAEVQDEAQDRDVASFSVPSTTVEVPAETVPAETAPVRLTRDTAETAPDETNIAGTGAPTGRALRVAPAVAKPTASEPDANVSAAGAPATLVGVDPTAKSAATKPQERRPDRRPERPDPAPVVAPEFAREPAPETAREPAPETARRGADDGRGAAAAAAVAPRGNASETARDSDTYEDRRGATRGRAGARAAATPGGDASGRAAGYVGKDHRAKTATSARSKAVLGKDQRRAEASACSRARMKTTAPDGTVSWSRSWSCHSSWATSSRR